MGNADSTLNKTASPDALAHELRRRLDNPDTSSRINDADPVSYNYLTESPILKRLTAEESKYFPGMTYVVWSEAENGKSAALQDFILIHLDGRDGLYVSAGCHSGIVRGLQEALNTACSSRYIVKALVTALESKACSGKPFRKSYLVIDQVNYLNTAVYAENAGFIQSLFQKVADSGSIVCTIASYKKDTATALVNLNGGKIQPHRSFTSKDWENTGRDPVPAWKDVSWTVSQLEALLKLRYPKDYENVEHGFLVDGMTPGDAISEFTDLLYAAR